MVSNVYRRKENVIYSTSDFCCEGLFVRNMPPTTTVTLSLVSNDETNLVPYDSAFFAQGNSMPFAAFGLTSGLTSGCFLPPPLAAFGFVCAHKKGR